MAKIVFNAEMVFLYQQGHAYAQGSMFQEDVHRFQDATTSDIPPPKRKSAYHVKIHLHYKWVSVSVLQAPIMTSLLIPVNRPQNLPTIQMALQTQIQILLFSLILKLPSLFPCLAYLY
jgi:hypothetical protein